MTGAPAGSGEGRDRFEEASEWFARMRGPDASGARAAFEAWRSKPGNDEAYQEIEAIWQASAAVSRPLVRPRVRPRPAGLGPGLIAAGIAAALTIGFLAWRSADRSETSIYASERGQIRYFALADGSRVTLDTGSRIRVDLSGEERRVLLLAGRARFAVARDPAHPFVVQAGDDAVVARGTVFDVRLAAGSAEVALFEGAVDLERREPRAPPRVLARLHPGQKAVFASGDAPPAIAATRVQPWPQGVLSGDDLRLGDIVSEANRYGKAQIRLGDPALGDLRLSGGFRPADTRNLAEGVAASLGLTVTQDADGTLVLSRKRTGPIAYGGQCGALAGMGLVLRMAG